MSTITDLSIAYLNAGMTLVPLPIASKGPTTKGWNLRENCVTDLSTVNQVIEGVGLALAYCAEPRCTLDVDMFSAAANWLHQRGIDLRALLDAADAVQIVSDKADKAKLVYRLPPEVGALASKTISLDRKTILEFRCATADGKTVQDVLPPSIHPDTKQPYRWGGSGHYNAIPMIPEALLTIWLSLLGKDKHTGESRTPRVGSLPEETSDGMWEDTMSALSYPETTENIAKVSAALSRLSADCEYSEWCAVLFALKSTGWSIAEQLARAWSMSAPDRWERPKPSFDKTWGSASKHGGISIGTLFYKARTESGAQVGDPISHAAWEHTDSHANEFTLPAGRMVIPTSAPPGRQYLFAKGVLRGTMAIMAGLGGTAKTTLAMQICVHGALGKELHSLEVAKFSSLLFLGEESEAERDRRFGALCADMTDAERADVQRNVLCFPAAGEDLRLTWLNGNNPVSSGLGQQIIALAKQHEEMCSVPVGLIVLDHARLVMAGDPNAAEDVSQLTRVLTEIAIATDSAVLLLAHSPKSVHSKDNETDSSEIAGSSAFVDNARCAFVLSTMRPTEAKEFEVTDSERKDYVCLTTAKANYGPSGTKWWFKKQPILGWQTIKLVPAQLYPKGLFPSHNALSVRILDLVRQSPGCLTERNVRDRGGTRGALKASEAEVTRTLARLIDEGGICKRPPTDAERKQHHLSPNARVVLDIP